MARASEDPKQAKQRRLSEQSKLLSPGDAADSKITATDSSGSIEARADSPEEIVRRKATGLLCRSFQEDGEASRAAQSIEMGVGSVAEALERAVFDAATNASEYRFKVRSLAAALRRSSTGREQLLRGKLKPRELAERGGEECLLTSEQRAQREKWHVESLEQCLGTRFGGLGYYVMGVDCSGTNCHEECERRHLDARERSRGEWPPLSESRLIICAGPERSGSTWLYNAVRLLHLKAKVPCDSYWIACLTEESLRERLAARPSAVVCVKTHEWHPDYEVCLNRDALVILTHRDLRGVCASYRRVKWAVGISDAYVEEHMQWRQRCTLDLGYEDIVRNGEQVLQRLLEQLGLSLDIADISLVNQELLGLKRSHAGNAVCQVTKLWPDHVSNEARRLQGQASAVGEELNALKDPDYEQVLNSRYRKFQELYGYV